MFFLTKLFEIRDQSNPEAEKPFLAHLDDLRVTLTRIILTLVLATLVCYVFRNQLMDIIRHPVEQVWTLSQKSALDELDPKPSLATWEKAVRVSNDAIGLTPGQRNHFQKFAGTEDENFAFHVEAAYHFRIALAIEDEKAREKYVATIPGLSPEMHVQLKKLVRGNPNAQLDAKGRMVLMQSLNPTEGFMLSVKLAFFAALVVSFPLLLFFLLQFVLPGLHKAEQRALFPALGIGFCLFLTGVLFAYFIILPNVLDFFYQYSLEMGIQNDWRIGYYISFATQFVLIFGLAFELPVVVMTLVKLGILSYEMMRTTRSYAILAIVVIAAIITPTPDALTLGLLAVPMYILYEICIWLAYFIDKKEKAKEAAEEEERMARLLAAPGAASRNEEDDLDEEQPVTEEPETMAPPEEIIADEDDYAGPDPEAEDLYSQAPIEPDEEPDKEPNQAKGNSSDSDNREEDSNFDPLK
ncbi:twin-arginine translocase subunit TatC [Roseibacillus ishigakijimensis]|uniref:Sec-independent protein translocase protein TatC n=1 Tax=Roseibacillus ishigakijimensis TaxID=454146 RepID=A0A934RRG9_9BACT|nr:twin-arginine translocase subunit TatC [Roseibacillus ishigakijimensis]MBK1835568.1 twin-arginine translocase subunit TatC [Roseibacillus ishigakijimensis]